MNPSNQIILGDCCRMFPTLPGGFAVFILSGPLPGGPSVPLGSDARRRRRPGLAQAGLRGHVTRAQARHPGGVLLLLHQG